jgi:hypothetical protein
VVDRTADETETDEPLGLGIRPTDLTLYHELATVYYGCANIGARTNNVRPSHGSRLNISCLLQND